MGGGRGDSTEAEFHKRTGRMRISERNSPLRIESLNKACDPDLVSEESICSRLWLVSTGAYNFQISLPSSSCLD